VRQSRGVMHLNMLLNPKVFVVVFIMFVIAYIIFIEEEGGFTKDFLRFGPSETRFLGITLNTWPRVIALYTIGFLIAIVTTYYDTAIKNHLHSYIWNKAIKKIPFSSTWTHASVILEPFFDEVLMIVQFFTTMTMQLQFLVPQFLGHFLVNVPFALQRLAGKRFAAA